MNMHNFWKSNDKLVTLIAVAEAVRTSLGPRGMDKMVNNCFQDHQP